MFNKEFLQTLTILYVEDDFSVRNALSNILQKIFDTVIIASDGQEGLEKYHEHTLNHLHIDAIISDINMPNMNGLEMAKAIRELNDNIPIIMTTAHGEAHYLLEAIQLRITGYILKPVDTKELLLIVQKHCEAKRNENLIKDKEKELSEYMNFIDTLATIIKIDSKGFIEAANPYFCAMMEMQENELIGLEFSSLLHQDSISNNLKDLHNTISKDEVWHGKLKFLSKKQEMFILRTTNITRKNQNTNETEGFISIGFLADEEEAERKETLLKARSNILEQKHKILLLNKELDNLKVNSTVSNSRNQEENLQLLKEALENERYRNNELNAQLKHYEEENKALQFKLENISGFEQFKRSSSLKQLNDLKKENAKLQNKLIESQALITKLTPKPEYMD